jgi:ATP-dependent exoDNAse (exonuclease V) beta subunit
MFSKNDPRINKVGRPRKKTLQDILDEMGAKILDKQGNVLDSVDGSEALVRNIVEAGIKEKDPAMMKFIYQRLNVPQADPETSELKKRTERARAQKIEIQNAERRKELVETAAVRLVFGHIYAAFTSIVLPLGAKLADQVAAEYKLEDAAARVRVQEIMDDELYAALAGIKREINDFLRRCAAEPITESAPPPKPTRKAEKKIG